MNKRWKWNNVPIPEAYLVGLAIGIALHAFFSKPLFQLFWVGPAIGWPLFAVGVGLAIHQKCLRHDGVSDGW